MNQNQSLHICRELAAAAGKSYSEIPFAVSPETEYISIRGHYTLASGDSGVIDIGLRDAQGEIRGWSGNLNRLQQIFIGEEQASLGYLAGPLGTGTWHILLGDSRAHSQSIRVELEIELQARQSRIVRGDIHGHSLHSDGAHSIETKLQMAQDSGLDFLGFTDHNSVAQNFCLPGNPDVLLLPSCEITSYNGHVNIFGYRERRIPNFMCRSSEDMRQTLEDLKASAVEGEGPWLQLNHPIRQGDVAGCQWNWSYDMPFDWLEIWNGPWNQNNVENLKMWQGLLERGRFLPAVGNSDFHDASSKTQGYPCNNVWVEKKSSGEIFRSLAKGQNYITAEPLPQRSFALRCSQPDTGDFLPLGTEIAGTQLQLELSTASSYLSGLGPLLLRVWSAAGLCREQSLAPSDFCPCDEVETHDRVFSLCLEAPRKEPGGRDGRDFLRLELFQRKACNGDQSCEDALLLSNPVFFS